MPLVDLSTLVAWPWTWCRRSAAGALSVHTLHCSVLCFRKDLLFTLPAVVVIAAKRVRSRPPVLIYQSK
uniref:Uncharacterized protein n=1 Tax=Aegilops tauschii subsp. strangulata TaxID=200361 RepID=A0A453LTD4_AEGTS